MGAWETGTWTGSVAAFHEADLPPGRTVWTARVDTPTVVLGSSQPDTDLDPQAVLQSGVTVVRRRSGGGAVWLDADSAWIDIVIPAGDPLWVDDVPRSMVWLGEVFARVIGGDARVWTEPYVASTLARSCCFGGLAPGEVVGERGKIVGISQRRTRTMARFQCVAYAAHTPGDLASVLADRAVATAAARIAVQTVPWDPGDLAARVLSALSD